MLRLYGGIANGIKETPYGVTTNRGSVQNKANFRVPEMSLNVCMENRL